MSTSVISLTVHQPASAFSALFSCLSHCLSPTVAPIKLCTRSLVWFQCLVKQAGSVCNVQSDAFITPDICFMTYTCMRFMRCQNSSGCFIISILTICYIIHLLNRGALTGWSPYTDNQLHYTSSE